MNLGGYSAAETALLLVDLQNDFLHPDGAYGRAGLGNAALAALPTQLEPVLAAARAAGVFIVTTHFTLVRARDGQPMVSDHLRAARPFLTAGDFDAGTWGHDSVQWVGASDARIEKVAYSAFAHTRLEWLLRKVGVSRLLVAGIVTNGGVASTVRDAHVREFDVTVLGDGCAAFRSDVHDATLVSLGSVVDVTTCVDVVQSLSAGVSRP